jgi:adenine-specific DNA-methyltransferase
VVDEREEILLLADLLGAVNRVANIAGTYGCFLSIWTSQAMQPIELQARRLREDFITFRVSNFDALMVEVGEDDTVYFDPPYTKRQYASYYHIPETIVWGDEPQVEGVAGLRPWKELASVYCYKAKALPALISLAENSNARRVFFSYSNAGHVDLGSLSEGLSPLGAVKTHVLGPIGSYRPNQTASTNRKTVSEFLIALRRKKSKKPGRLAA